ncbi:MAG TPA: histidine phosphatase family protein, partial [Quisquiliibacterium sp.]|nr:histidine phosphatase family protein [Quisquiliibacterium sp.]
MNLILWRHAEAEDAEPDLERRLTARGRKQAKRMADWLNAQLPERFVVIASPAQRTRQTADALECEYRVDRRLSPDA